jgi:ferritin-like metal-binding protein YciE
MAKISEPTELFIHKLGATLTMEQTILDMLEELQEKANDPQLQKALQHHHQETQQQIGNLEKVFQALGAEPETESSPTIEGLEKEGKQMLKEVEDDLNDAVILSGVIETEHHEIAVYDGLIIQAEAMGEEDVRALLLENLEQEEATLEKAVKQAEQLSKELARA